MKVDPFRLIGADAARTCWRVAAIYRCCLRHGASPSWARDRLREIYPDGSRDHLVEAWFLGMDLLRGRITAEQERARAGRDRAIAA